MSSPVHQNMPGNSATGKRLINSRFYTYTTTHSLVAAGATDSKTFTVGSDSDFFLVKMSMFADIAGAAQTDSSRVIPLMTVQLTETTNGNQMFDVPVPVASMFGTGQIPFILPREKFFPAKSVVSVDVANFSAATTYSLRLTFVGYRAYYA